MTSVCQLNAALPAQKLSTSSGSEAPVILTPISGPICPMAISTADAVMKPAITGCDRKLAMKPIRNRPIPNSIAPDNAAKVSAAVA